MLAIVVASDDAYCISEEYSINQWLSCKNTRYSYFNQNAIKNIWLKKKKKYIWLSQWKQYIYDTDISAKHTLSLNWSFDHSMLMKINWQFLIILEFLQEAMLFFCFSLSIFYLWMTLCGLLHVCHTHSFLRQ